MFDQVTRCSRVTARPSRRTSTRAESMRSCSESRKRSNDAPLRCDCGRVSRSRLVVRNQPGSHARTEELVRPTFQLWSSANPLASLIPRTCSSHYGRIGPVVRAAESHAGSIGASFATAHERFGVGAFGSSLMLGEHIDAGDVAYRAKTYGLARLTKLLEPPTA
jgi:hypothetical protein